MRVDKYTMAQSWMRQDDATPEEAKATWDTLETEFEDKRKAQLMASAETDEIIKTINDKFGPGTLFPASQAPIPPMTDTQAIMEWEERNRKAGGGRIGFQYTGPVKFKNIIKPKKFEQGNRWKKMPPGTYTMRLYMGLDENGNRIEETFTGTKKQLKKIFDKKNKGRVVQKASEKASAASYNKPYKVLQGANKGKYMITYGGGSMSPKVTNYFDPKDYGSDKAAFDAANTELTDYKNRPDKWKNMSRKKKVSPPDGYVSGKKMLQAAKKKNIYVSENRQASNFADVFNFPKTTKDGQMFYDISKLNNEKAVDTILEAQVRSGSATNYAKKKFPIKTVYDHTKKRYLAEKAAGGVKDSGWAGKKGSGVQLGHADDFWMGRRITPQNLLYTPTEINKLLGDPGMIDDKIHAVYEKQEYGKLTKKGDDLKKFLNETDKTLTRLASQTDGFKQVTLSDGGVFGGERLKVDVFDEFKGKSQKETIDFVNKWKDKSIITEEMVKNNPDLKVTPLDEVENIKKANFFEINRKAAYDAALKMSQKDKTKTMEKIKGGDFKNPQLNKFAQNMLSSGPAGALELFKADPAVRRIANSQGYKTFMKAARMPGKFFGIGDAVFGYFDYKNNLSKGQSHNVALQNAKQAMSFGLWKVGDEEVQKEIRERFVKEGGNPDIFDQAIALNKKTQQFQNRLNEFAEQSEWAGDKAAKSTFEKMLTKDMNDILNMRKQFSTDYAVSEAGAPIQIKDTSQPFTDVKKAAYEYAKEQSGRPDVLEGAAIQRDPTAGTMGNLLQNFLSWDFPNVLRLKPTQKMREEKQLKQLKEQDPVMFEKLLQSKGIYRSEGLNLPALINFSMQYPEYGVSFETEKKANGGIASLRRKK